MAAILSRPQRIKYILSVNGFRDALILNIIVKIFIKYLNRDWMINL